MMVNDPADVVAILDGADHVDRKYITSDVSLRAFVAGFLGYHPWWIRTLYRIRGYGVRLFGLKQTDLPRRVQMNAADVPMVVGRQAGFFTVAAAQEEQYWIARASDRHLTAHLGIVRDVRRPQQFQVLTVVHYHHWTGPVYFNLIRPFHHVVVASMMGAGARGTLRQAGT